MGRYTSGIWFGYGWVGGCVFVCNENIIISLHPSSNDIIIAKRGM